MFSVILHIYQLRQLLTSANGSLNPDLFFLENVHLVEKGNLKMVESVFNSIRNCNGVTCNKQKKFLKSSKMAVSFKLNNNFGFAPLTFSTVSKSVSPVSLFSYHLLLHASRPVMFPPFHLNFSLIPPKSLMLLFDQVMPIQVNLFVPVNLRV